MTNPGVPPSPGLPPLDHAARDAIRMAQDRLGVLTRGRMPAPQPLSEQEKADALKSAATDTCLLCGALHAAPNTPACPRVATCKINPDGKVTEASFWPDLVTDSAVELDGEGTVRAVTFSEHRGWNAAGRVVLPEDVAEEDGGEKGPPVLHVTPDLASGQVLTFAAAWEWTDIIPGLQWRVSRATQGVEFRATPRDVRE